MDKYVILGIHGEGVTTTDNVARVRMFVNGSEVDEDFLLPYLPDVVPHIASVYEYTLKPDIEQRISELENGVKDTLNSKVSSLVKTQDEQIIVGGNLL